MNTMNIDASTALITGGSRGIGRAIADELATRGIDCVLVSRSEDDLSAAAEEIQGEYNVNVETISADLSEGDAVREVYAQVKDMEENIDILVNNAGFGTHGRLVDTDMDTEVSMVRLNIEAVIRLTKLFLPQMVDSGEGYVMNLASTAAFQPGPLMANYYATKSYVLSLTVALNQECAGTDVSATALCPGPTDTSFITRAHTENMRGFQDADENLSAQQVAQSGVKGMFNKQAVVVPGISNKITAFLGRVFPAPLTARVAEYVNSPA